MQVLVFDADPSIDQSVLRYLHARSYEITITRNPSEALDLVHRTEFDCILLDVATAADSLGLLEIRQLVRASAVAFMTTMPVEALVAEALVEGSMEFQSFPVLINNLEHLDQPTMLAGANLPATLFMAARDKGLRISNARTLQFAMNLLVDGWCQIVWLYAEIPGLAESDQGAIVRQFGAKQLAILASGLSDSTPGITCRRKPEKATEFIALLQHIAGNQAARCGLTEVRGRHHNSR
jgi:CheY-like chemotaxis protein